MRRIAVSDIHGCARTFRHLIDQQVRLGPEDHLYLLGDYVNRGPDPWGVFDFIFDLQGRGVRVVCLRGNHEDRLLEAYDQGRYAASLRYIRFVRSLPSYHLLDGFVLVHAGLNFSVPHPLHDQVSMRWIRHWEHTLDHTWLGQRRIVHGHVRTPRAEIERRVRSDSPILRIDNGCFAITEAGQGSLCALDLDQRTLWFQPNLDMLEATPLPWWRFWER